MQNNMWNNNYDQLHETNGSNLGPLGLSARLPLKLRPYGLSFRNLALLGLSFL